MQVQCGPIKDTSFQSNVVKSKSAKYPSRSHIGWGPGKGGKDGLKFAQFEPLQIV